MSKGAYLHNLPLLLLCFLLVACVYVFLLQRMGTVTLVGH